MSDNSGTPQQQDDAAAAAAAATPGAQDSAAPGDRLAPIFDVRNRGPPPPPPNGPTRDFPVGVPDAVKASVVGYVLKPGEYHAEFQVAKPSVLHFWGVRCELAPKAEWKKDDKGKLVERKQLFYCMADDACRTAGTVLSITNRQTSSATGHLKKHKIKSTRTQEQEQKALEEQASLDTIRNSNLFRTDPDRYLAQEFVKAFPIDAAAPFNLAEHSRVRRFFSLMNEKFDVGKLNNKAVKKMIGEMYDATTRAHNAKMQPLIRNAFIPIVYVLTDLWTSEVSGHKFIAVRATMLDQKMVVQTYLLAVKLFRPDPALGKVTGEVLKKYVLQVLAEHGISKHDVIGAVTDAGGDVRRGVGLQWFWEWCLAHLLNRVMVDGTGMSPKAVNSKNPLCRGLLEVIKKMVGHFNKSAADQIVLESIIDDMSEGPGSKAKLAQAVAQRWVSTCKMLRRVLERWDALRTFYIEHDSTPFPLDGRKDEVEEVYTIVKGVNDVVVYSQTTFESTAVGGLQKLATLGTVLFEPQKPLKVLHVRQTGQSGEHPAPTAREHTGLTKTGVATREAFLQALAWRFVRPRYGTGLRAHSHIYDIAHFLCPDTRRMTHLKTVRESTLGSKGGYTMNVDAVKRVIQNQALALLVKGIEKSRETRAAAPRASIDLAPPSAKRTKRTSSGSATAARKEAEARREALKEAGMVESSSDEEDTEGGGQPEKTAREEAVDILEKWKKHKFSTDDKEMDPIDYWREHGGEWPAVLLGLAQAVLGAPASAGCVERDFCIADVFQPRKRGSVDPANLEMTLYLRGQLSSIPLDVPKLNDEEAARAIPDRLTDKAKLEEVRVMNFLPDNSAEDFEDEDEDEELRVQEEQAPQEVQAPQA